MAITADTVAERNPSLGLTSEIKARSPHLPPNVEDPEYRVFDTSGFNTHDLEIFRKGMAAGAMVTAATLQDLITNHINAASIADSVETLPPHVIARMRPDALAKIRERLDPPPEVLKARSKAAFEQVRADLHLVDQIAPHIGALRVIRHTTGRTIVDLPPIRADFRK